MVKLFGALSDDTRLRIIKLLDIGELCVCDITAALELSQPKVSFHLSILKEAGLIVDRKDGKWVYYSLGAGDLFTRFLIISICEKYSNDADIKRLENSRNARACQ
ncbi:ArsR/SmtB family transcription factor [Candidatus Magnetominusculus xianensis]|uniref:DNA-binding transcriptional repressor ArsR n=1 Tax=Candidatus Magnetominusculus xianensis TaxID=1748249 RepID=A0ABR5SGG0_9BACT|nr:metalloregulator ArsR/SmtB family transcription factor [Candidatus Magnetominusculus xianensis]KWT88549.1 DNA-binding transcriptional repressor ArsR [Candidatus Magnetominusculus xianensis]MBF0404093.1 metalloregulator ArsR/SmtB family transcription factor [Nitrospirota bacterium]